MELGTTVYVLGVILVISFKGDLTVYKYMLKYLQMKHDISDLFQNNAMK